MDFDFLVDIDIFLSDHEDSSMFRPPKAKSWQSGERFHRILSSFVSFFPLMRRKDLVARREYTFELLLLAHLQPPTPVRRATMKTEARSFTRKRQRAQRPAVPFPSRLMWNRVFFFSTEGTVMQLSTCIAEAFLSRFSLRLVERPCTLPT